MPDGQLASPGMPIGFMLSSSASVDAGLHPSPQSTQPIHPDMLPSSHFVYDTRSCATQHSSGEGSAPEVRSVGQRRAAAGHELLEPHVEALVPAHDVAVLLHLLVLAQHAPCTSQHAQHTLGMSAGAASERQQLGTPQGAGSRCSPRDTETKGKEGRNCLYKAAVKYKAGGALRKTRDTKPNKFEEQHSMHLAAGRRRAFVDDPYSRSDGQRALMLHAGNSVNTGCPSASSRVMSAAHIPRNDWQDFARSHIKHSE